MAKIPADQLKPYFLTFDDLNGPLEWESFFGNDHPVELDIGCGRGLFLLNASLAHPEINFLGLEVDYTTGRYSARKLMKRSLPNARVLGGDCRIAMESLLPPDSVSAAHVYFPDPWWKRKHLRRRIFTPSFVKLLKRVLKPGGIVHSWTDVEDYFEKIAAHMNDDEDFTICPAPSEEEPAHDMDYHTSFERKKRQEGCTIYRGKWQLGKASYSYEA